ncbi:MAG: hypothetical protein ACE15C_04160 [Phycisphaerae bacterium]
MATVLAAVGRAAGAEGIIDVKWESVGPGGGGGHMYPAISAADPNIMLFACDMGGIYLSLDGAKSWRMLPGQIVRRLSAPAGLHPTNGDRIYLICFNGLWASFDRGRTWQRTIGEGETPRQPQYGGAGIFFDPAKPDTMYAVFSLYAGEKGSRVMRSDDGGRKWSRVESWQTTAPAAAIFIDPTSPADARTVYTMATDGVMRTADWGKTWTTLKEGLPAGKLTGFAAAWDAKGGSAFYASVAPSEAGGKYVGGVYKSTDAGKTWTESSNGLYRELVKGRRGLMQYSGLAMGAGNLDLAYVIADGVNSNAPGQDRAVWRTADGGKTWACVSYGRPQWKECNVDPDWMSLDLEGGWGWSGGPEELVCCSSRPEIAFFTNGGNGYITTDAGKRWSGMFTTKAELPFYRGRGAEVLTCYQVYVDPQDKPRRWITYTDIGLFTSKDGGSSWAYAAKGCPWSNTCYELALDPAVPGKAWGAWSNFHDLPHFKMLSQDVAKSNGGVAVTEDYGMTWKSVGAGEGGLATSRGSCTTVVIDADSPKDSRTLYAGFLNQGVFKSVDGGKTWKDASKGLPEPPRRNVWRLVRHADGTLLCAVTANFPGGKHVAGGLFVSTDGAASWKPLGADQPFDWIFGLAVDTRSSKTIYVSCFEVPPQGDPARGTQVPWGKGNGHGGVYKSADGGATWAKILDRPYCWDVTFHPRNPDTIFACTFADGLYRSTDAGKTFVPLAQPPFICTHRVTVEPGDDSTIWVTTFGGGVWKGKITEPPK